MTEQQLQDAILKHTLQILRLSAGEANQVDGILVELARELRDLIQQANLTDATKRDVEALIKSAEDSIAVGYKRANASTDTYELAVIVAEKAQEIVQDTIPAEVRMPTDTLLMQLGKDVLIDGAPSSAWWAKQSDDLAFRFAAQVRQGMANSETQEQIVARIVGKRGEPGIMDVARRNARALVHSSVMTAANQARLATFRKNSRIIAGVRYIAALDGHTCATCAALDGQSWNLDGERLKGTTVDFLPPPRHFGCFPEGTLVLSRREITGASKRWFDGEVVVIKTAAGRELTCTPNHPILTDGGWVAAGLLDIGSNVICDGGGEWESLGDGHGQNVPTGIHHVTEAFFTARKMRPMPVEVAPEDFHGDGGGSKVAIVWSDGLLRGQVDAPCNKHFRQSLFVSGSSAGLVGFTGSRSLASGFEREQSSDAFTGALCHALAVLRASAPHPRELLGATIARHNAMLAENGESYHSGDSEPFSDAGDADTLSVGFDDILSLAASDNKRGTDGLAGLAQQREPAAPENSVYRLTIDAKASGDMGASLTGGIGASDFIDRQALPDMATHLDAEALQLIGDRCAGATNLASDFFSRPPERILLDKISEIAVFPFSGHVYNLETTGGWYVAQGIVVHNCRCVLSPIPKTFADIGLNIPEPEVGQRASSMGPVHGKTTFQDFLSRQSDEFVNNTLGKKRAELFREGKLTVRDLVSGTGRELTLAELRKH